MRRPRGGATATASKHSRREIIEIIHKKNSKIT